MIGSCQNAFSKQICQLLLPVVLHTALKILHFTTTATFTSHFASYF